MQQQKAVSSMFQVEHSSTWAVRAWTSLAWLFDSMAWSCPLDRVSFVYALAGTLAKGRNASTMGRYPVHRLQEAATLDFLFNGCSQVQMSSRAAGQQAGCC